MKIQRQREVLRVIQVRDLSQQGARTFAAKVHAALPGGCATIEVDLSQTNVLDSWGLAALVEVYRCARGLNRRATVRLVHPRPAVQQVIDLTRLNRLFEIVPEPHG